MSQYREFASVRYVAILLVSVLLAAASTYYVASLNFSPQDLYVDDMPSTPTYTYVVETDGTWIWATRYHGEIQWSSTNASNVFEALSSLNGKFIIREGTYNIDVPYVVTTSVQQEWTGVNNQTIINCTASMHEMFSFEDTSKIIIRGLRFQSNNLVSHCIWYKGTKGALDERFVIEDCFFRNARYYAVRLTRKQDERTKVMDSTFRVNRGHIWFDGMADSEIGGNYFVNSPKNVTQMYDAQVRITASANRIHDNYWASGYGHGLFLNKHECIVTGNIFDNIRYEAIVIGWGHGNVIAGNRISGCGRDANSTYAGIKVIGSSENNEISGNYFQSDIGSLITTKYAVLEESPADYNKITSNTIGGAFGSNPVIYVVGNHTQVSGNLGYRLGEITNPVKNGYLVDSIGTGSIVNNTIYTACQSPKTIYVQGQEAFDIKVNDVLVFDDVTEATVHLSCGDTFEIEWSSAPTITVIGE